MTLFCPARYLVELRARREAMSREASRYPMHEQKPYRSREAYLMNEEAKERLMIAEERTKP